MDLENEVDNICSSTKATDIKVNDVFNRFHLLSNEKFVENVFFFYFNIRSLLTHYSLFNFALFKL